QDRMTVNAVLSGSADTAVATEQAASSGVLDGAQLSAIPQQHPAYGEVMGVLVTAVQQNSRAWNNGLRANDIITAVNRRIVTTPNALEDILADSANPAVALNIVREGQNLFLIVR